MVSESVKLADGNIYLGVNTFKYDVKGWETIKGFMQRYTVCSESKNLNYLDKYYLKKLGRISFAFRLEFCF